MMFTIDVRINDVNVEAEALRFINFARQYVSLGVSDGKVWRLHVVFPREARRSFTMTAPVRDAVVRSYRAHLAFVAVALAASYELRDIGDEVVDDLAERAYRLVWAERRTIYGIVTEFLERHSTILHIEGHRGERPEYATSKHVYHYTYDGTWTLTDGREKHISGEVEHHRGDLMPMLIEKIMADIHYHAAETWCYGPDGDGIHGPCPYWDRCMVRQGESCICKYRWDFIPGEQKTGGDSDEDNG